ncbi:MAG: sensor N-terminal transmembrane domain-containing protein [Alphaproteobacteria bacterium]|nr:sensor N-terminal transmembrane domain-containing protein [Alphaproteobacteria bacterium]
MLVRKILAINLVPLALFLVALYLIHDIRPNLVMTKVESLTARGHLIALSIENSAVMEDLETINPSRLDIPDKVGLFPAPQLGYAWPPAGLSPLEARKRLVHSWAEHLVALTPEPDLGIRLVDPLNGENLVGDSRESVEIETMADERAWQWPSWSAIVDDWFVFSGRRSDVPVEGPEGVVGEAARGAASWTVVGRGTNDMRFVVAVPVRKKLYRTVVGVLVLSARPSDDELDLLRRQEVIMLIALVAFALTAGLSVWLARVITRPLVELSDAATDVRRGRKGSRDIPDHRARGDEIGRLAEALIMMTGSLERRVEDGKEIARNSAHEIRNAVTGMGGALMILENNEAALKKKMVALALAEAGRLERLADDMQDLSKLDDLLVRTPTTLVDVARLLTMHADPDVWLERHGVTVRHGPGLAGPARERCCLVDGLEDRLVQVVLNLLANAVSFSPPGGVITVDCNRRGGWVSVSVIDQGPGIPPGTEESIFAWLEQRRDPAENGEHSGIGLTISRQIVHAFGGEIFARNVGEDADHPEGACFTVRLPEASPRRRWFLDALGLPGGRGTPSDPD